ncbi:NAD(P)H-binding protein [Desulfosediminicola flagellatus]|uniref:NAD(P)H-binding protein n=1 Tax=Desulfosediminicola flagellatus TaxID=2569541 RepID=UPI0010AD22E2|nr:NAD(P)H-binding protein [Desulfosediminicola flagellatus]
MGKTAIVIGATGVVGREVVNQLAEADHIDTIITLTRRVAEHPSSKVENSIVDFDDLDSYSLLFEGDMLFSCLGTTRRAAGSVAAQRIVDLDYQLKVAQLASQNGVHHYLLVSSSGANEKSSNAYLQMKGELEQKVLQLGFPRVSIFQPSLLVGERSKVRLGEKIASAVLPAVCCIPGLERYRPIKGKQVAEKMVQVSSQVGNAVEKFVLDEIFISK